jgi:hypothetical protein
MEPGDFIAPAGELEASFFPAGTITARVTEYLADAEAKAAAEAGGNAEAVQAWTYYLAYRAAALYAGTRHVQESVGSSSRTINTNAPAYLQKMAAWWLARWQQYLASGIATPPNHSYSVRNEPTW